MRILIVDDEKNIVDLIKRSVEMEGYEAICASNGKEAVSLLKSHNPDIILLDIMLPDMDGYEVLEQIHTFDPARPVIFITAQDKLTNRILGLEMGADDYITKPFHTKELVLKIRALWRRIHQTKAASIKSDSSLYFAGVEIHPTTRKVCIDQTEVVLTYKEFDMIYFLAANYARVFSREQLINEIWGFDYMGQTRAVDILVKRLRTKITPYGNYIHTLYAVGYKFEVPK